MPSTVRELLEAADLTHGGLVSWGQAVPIEEPGVYLVSLNDDPETRARTLASAPIDNKAVAELLRERPELTVDNTTGTPNSVSVRVGEFWLPDEDILYIGLAGTSLRQRVNAYYSTKLGHRSPHAGGWLLKLLTNLPELHVHFAATQDPKAAEDLMLGRFVTRVSAETRRALRDPDRPFPFANLEWPKGVRKSHGIRGATGRPGTSTPVTKSDATKKSEQIYPRPPGARANIEAMNRFLQEELRRRERTEVAAVEAARWLDRAGLLTDSADRPGLPLRDLLRAGLITGQRQEPNRRWFIDLVDGL